MGQRSMCMSTHARVRSQQEDLRKAAARIHGLAPSGKRFSTPAVFVCELVLRRPANRPAKRQLVRFSGSGFVRISQSVGDATLCGSTLLKGSFRAWHRTQPYFHNDVVTRQAFAPRAKLAASDEVIARPAARTRSNSEPIASVSVATTRS
jgi:hypothetical protein